MKLHYQEEGRGPAVLLVHAFPLDHTMWMPQIAVLKERFRMIAPDIRGFGQTPVAAPWTLEQAADDLAELLDELRIEECTVAGLSMGGYIALPFYDKYPQRVRHLILADTRARADNEAEKSARTDMIAALQHSGAGILPERMLPRLLKPEAAADVTQNVRRMMATTTEKAAIAALMAMRDRPDASHVLHKITCPTLVVAGEHDAITRVEECRSMAETVQNGKFALIPDAGHLSNLENVTSFNVEVAKFLP